jgi:hypothetical protein
MLTHPGGFERRHTGCDSPDTAASRPPSPTGAVHMHFSVCRTVHVHHRSLESASKGPTTRQDSAPCTPPPSQCAPSKSAASPLFPQSQLPSCRRPHYPPSRNTKSFLTFFDSSISFGTNGIGIAQIALPPTSLGPAAAIGSCLLAATRTTSVQCQQRYSW